MIVIFHMYIPLEFYFIKFYYYYGGVQ